MRLGRHARITRAGAACALLLGAGLPGQRGVRSGDSARPLALMPHATTSFGAATQGAWVYCYGGHIGRAHAHSRENTLGLFYRVSLSHPGVQEMLPPGRALQSPSLVAAHDGSLVRVGGLEARNAKGEKEDLWSVDEVMRFDPAAGTWSALPALPEPRSSHDAFVIGSKLYVHGGWCLRGPGERRWLTNTLCMDLAAEAPRWRELASGARARRAFALAAHGERLVAIGGMGPEGILTAVDTLDPETGAWREIAKWPGYGFANTATSVGGRVYATGLEGGVYTLAGGAWREVARCAFARFFSRAVPGAGQSLVVLGGADMGGHARVIESVELAPTSEVAISSIELPFPGRAKRRHGVLRAGDSFVLMGGNDSTREHAFGAERFVDEVWRFHPSSARFVAADPLARAAQSFVTATMGASDARRMARGKGLGLAVGGFFHDGEEARSSDAVWTVDSRRARVAAAGATLPESRTQFALLEHGGRHYVLGGTDFDPTRPRGEQFGFPREVYTLARGGDGQGVVREAAGFALPRPRRAFGAAMLGARAYLVGGMREKFQTVAECDVYDFEREAWTTIPAPRAPRISPTLLAVGGKLVLLGGKSPARASRDADSGDTRRPRYVEDRSVELYDPARRRWRVLVEELPFATSEAHFVAWQGQVLCLTTHFAERRACGLHVLRLLGQNSQ